MQVGRAVPRNPAIPGTARDRTGSGGLLRRALAQINQRFEGLRREVLAVFERIPVYALNDEAAMVRYGITPEVMDETMLAIQAALTRWLQDGREPRYLFWWNPFVDQAAQLGTAQSAANLAQLSSVYATARSLDQVIRSEPYRVRVGLARIKSYEHWTGLKGEVQSKLAGIIGRAVADGLNPRAAAKLIAEGLDISRGKARQYAQTDITDTLRQARWAESEATSEELGIKIGMLWTSALLPTTRRTHATRNGGVYSTDEVRVFYSQNGNRYNCYLPGTLVSGRFIAGSKARYQGPTVTLVTAGGRKLAVTTNHPVMTDCGLVPAAKIKVGDKLIAHCPQIKDAARIADLDGCHVGTRIEDVFGALVDSGHQSPARVSRVDFHGDAAFMDENIHVVRSNRVLTIALDAASAQLLDDLALVHPDPARARSRFEQQFFAAGNAPPRSGVGVGDAGFLLGGSVLQASSDLGGRSVAGGQPQILEALRDVCALNPGAHGDRQDGFASNMCGVQRPDGGGAFVGGVLVVPESSFVEPLHQRSIANPDAFGDVLERFPGLASLDEVVDVVFGYFDGHVYDLQEVSGLMISNSVIASNCHCGQTECLLDASGKPILTDRLKKTMAEERSSWAKSHGG